MLQVLKVLVRFALLSVFVVRGVFAYIDPNTGGLIFQLLAAILAFSSAMILFFPRQIRGAAARVWRAVRGIFPNKQ